MKTGHELRLTITQSGLLSEVACLGDKTDSGRDCTSYAMGAYPFIKGGCFIEESTEGLLLEEILGQFPDFQLPPTPVSWSLTRDTYGDYTLIEPAKHESEG